MLALDCAATEFFKDGDYDGRRGARPSRPTKWRTISPTCADDYPIGSIEDGMAEDDLAGWKALTDRLGAKIQLVGDDLFVTNPERLAMGIGRASPIRS